jgi:hypothetical protein
MVPSCGNEKAKRIKRAIRMASLSLSVCLSAIWGQAAAPQLAKLKGGPALPYTVDANWPHASAARA